MGSVHAGITGKGKLYCITVKEVTFLPSDLEFFDCYYYFVLATTSFLINEEFNLYESIRNS